MTTICPDCHHPDCEHGPDGHDPRVHAHPPVQGPLPHLPPGEALMMEPDPRTARIPCPDLPGLRLILQWDPPQTARIVEPDDTCGRAKDR